MSEARMNVAFVDDEVAVLRGMQRMLRPLRDEWDMSFYGSGQECLAALSGRPVDVVVTDMRMPGMDGMELLTEVSQLYPAVVRIVLSGQADRDTVMRAVEPTHQYLAKPCQPEVLRRTISRACTLRDILQDRALQRIVSGASRLPSLPSVYTEVSNALADGDTPLEQIGELISQDVAMTAKLLKFVNSAYFGIPRRVDSAGQAATILGMEMVKSLVLTVGVFSQFEQLGDHRFSIQSFEQHSQRTGLLAKAIASAEATDPETATSAYLAGFMHDIGKLVLLENIPEQYGAVLQAATDSDRSLHDLEIEHLGASHAAVGAYLLGIWGLPSAIVEAIAFHHSPGSLPEMQFGALTAVHAANALDHLSQTNKTAAELLDTDYLRSLQLLDRFETWTQLAATISEKGDS